MDFNHTRQKSEVYLASRGIPLHPNLPLLENLSLRPPHEVAERIVSLYSLLGLANGAKPKLVKNWLLDEGGWDFLSRHEQEVFEREKLQIGELNELSWKQESLYVLCWAASIIDTMAWPASEAKLNDVFPAIPPEIPIIDFVDSIVLRPFDQIVDALDMFYCLPASLEHPELWSDSVQSGVKVEIVVERRHALEWLCSLDTAWEDISLDT